ncbi:MAG: hypothetical protein K0Q60_3644 [Microvirga sp.]|jgi:hypothetical protein|nr:hypothetical protein [Microvirga sp.]
MKSRSRARRCTDMQRSRRIVGPTSGNFVQSVANARSQSLISAVEPSFS